MARIVIVGAGPVGATTARLLAGRHHEVVVVTRSAGDPLGEGIERVQADAAHPDALTAIAGGAGAIVNAVNPPYTKWASAWPPVAAAFLEAAARTGATLVTMGNLYGYGPGSGTMRADTPLRATGTNGRVRAAMWHEAEAAHRAGRVQVVEVRASDFFGPGVVDANMGERVVPRILRGRPVRVLGGLDVAHSFSFMPDVAEVVAAVAVTPETWGRPWLVPSVETTQRGLITALAVAAGVAVPRLGTIAPSVLRLAGLAVPMLRALREVEYQFAEPFVVDAADTTAALGVSATPLADAAEATVSWWQSHALAPV